MRRCGGGDRTSRSCPAAWDIRGMQRRHRSFPQASPQATDQRPTSAVAVCKTVGYAFDGSNPSPATTCENGPLAADLRLCGPFFLRLTTCHLVALWTVVLRYPRTYSGRRPAARTVGVTVGFPRTATDRGRGHGRATDRVCEGSGGGAGHSQLSGACTLCPRVPGAGCPVRSICAECRRAAGK